MPLCHLRTRAIQRPVDGRSIDNSRLQLLNQRNASIHRKSPSPVEFPHFALPTEPIHPLYVSGETAAEPVIRLAEITHNGTHEVLEIGSPHVNHILVRTGIEGNELLVSSLTVQIDFKAK